jgi:L-malate glycosyltransferase
MNVLILTKTFPIDANEWGGVFVKDQAEAIANQHVVTVVYFKVDYDRFIPFFNFYLETDNTLPYELVKITVGRSFPIYNQFNYILSVYRALKKVLRHKRPDIIHCHYSYPAGMIALLIKVKMGIPYVVTEHSKIRSTFRSIFHRIISLLALKRANKVIAVSKSLKNELYVEGIRNVDVVPNVIDTDRFELSKGTMNPFKIGFLGSLNSHNKGLNVLLDSCSELTFDFILKIGGGGKYLEHYREYAKKKKISDKCEFLGALSTQSKYSFYSDIDLFILASRYETFGIVLIEAMASGIPVLATHCGGPDDIIDNDEVGLFTDVGDSQMMVKKIYDIYSNYQKYNRYSIKNYAKSKFGHEPFLKSINRIYEQILYE